MKAKYDYWENIHSALIALQGHKFKFNRLYPNNTKKI